MATQKTYTAKKNGALFIQPDGPNSKPIYLGCYDVDDVQESRGGISLIQCFDVFGNYQTVGFTEEAPEPITVSLGTFTGKVREAMDDVKCPFALYMILRCGGRADLFTNYDRMVALDVAKVTSRTLSNWVKQNEDGASMSMYEAMALPPFIDLQKIQASRITIAETRDLNGIAFCEDMRCPGRCGDRLDMCDEGFISTDGAALTTANVLYRANAASSFVATAADPFAAAENITGVVCVRTGPNSSRSIVARGTTDAGNPAEVAYTDDSGATWTTVNVGSTNALFVERAHALFALDMYNVWVGLDNGDVYKSEDGGESWTAKDTSSLTNGVQAIWFINPLVGMVVTDGDEILITNDGGESWTAETTGSGFALQDVTYNEAYWWISSDQGIFYSGDNGLTWTQRTGFVNSGEDFRAIQFANKFFGMIVGVNAGGNAVAMYTNDGGFTWENVLALATYAVPLNDVFVCGTDLAYAVGNAVGGTGLLLKFNAPA